MMNNKLTLALLAVVLLSWTPVKTFRLDNGGIYNLIGRSNDNAGSKGTTVYKYRVSNNALTSWRPAVPEIRVFSDQRCTNEIDANYVDESGHNPGFGDGSAAFDEDHSTAWRPQCHRCNANAAWLIFSTTSKAHCVWATNLGSGSGGGITWNGGILVEIQNSDNCWATAMQSKHGNSANSVSESCPRPKGWCITEAATFLLEDCDGDGVLDPVCSDTNGNFGVIQSSKGCSSTWPGGKCSV